MKKKRVFEPPIMYFAFVFCIVLVFLASSLLYSKLSAESLTIVRHAVKMSSLPENGDYIICTWTQTTGYSWVMSSSKGLGEEHAFCLISGPTPLDLNLKYDFLISNNKYVFYVSNTREYYSSERQEDVIEYTVSGWDVLYPVRRESMITLLKNPKYILENDLNVTVKCSNVLGKKVILPAQDKLFI